MPGLNEMSLERAWKIFRKRQHYDQLYVDRAFKRLAQEILSHTGGAVCSDIELHYFNGDWYGVWDGHMRPLQEVLDELRDMKKPDGSIMRIRVFQPGEE